MKKSDLYKKIIVWSAEDNCFIGTCPELMDGGIHGQDALEVFKELCVAVDEVIEIYQEDGIPLPEPKEFVFDTV
jgi:predicted RNase H-like HicB family nuclease